MSVAVQPLRLRARVVGFAPHAELLRECGVYRRLWEAQRLDETAARAA